ncbi:MAG: glycosyl transferase [Chitinophagaceae bacterium]|jgi:uncharacterized protein (TIGR00661 family)|nr:glycosyl transferase [Chitinophagaceae bacterium]
MKILYAVQATGNGHISRAMELLPHLQKYGTIDIFLSGANSSLSLDAPVKFRSNGVSLFYNCNGGLDYLKMLKYTNPVKLQQLIKNLPVEKYDLVLNDFEYITAAACKKKKISSIQFGHQASFYSDKVPRPAKKSRLGEKILKKYAPATQYAGLHFEKYDDYIFTPIIKKTILDALPKDDGFVLVYLPSYCKKQLQDIFTRLKKVPFHIFTHDIKGIETIENVTFFPISNENFSQQLIRCTGIITGGGFETPAEAIHLGKKIMAIPIRNHYEQLCNAAALEACGITCLKNIDNQFDDLFFQWLQNGFTLKMDYSNSINEVLNYIFHYLKDIPGNLPEIEKDWKMVESLDILN